MPSKPVQLPSGNWRSVAVVGKKPDGKPLRKSFTDASKRAAYRKACEAEALYHDREVTEDSQLTVKEAIERLIDLKRPVLSPSTIMGYEVIQRTCFQGLMDIRLCDLTSTIVQKEISKEALVKSPKTVRNAHGLLNAVLRQYHPDLNLKTRLPQKTKEEVKIPPLSDIETIIKAADEKGDHELALAVMFGAQLGLRRSEMCALTFADIKDGVVRIEKALVLDNRGEWQVKPPKSAAGYRSIPLTEQLAARINSLSGAPCEQIFASNPNSITHRFERLQKQLPVQRFRFHDLRHYNASVMISLGIPIMYITRRLGHSSDDMVNRVYGHLIHDKQEDINRQMTDFFR